jgi:hypothetical protein
MFGEMVPFAPAVRYSRVLSSNVPQDINCKAMLVYFLVTVGIVLLAPQLHKLQNTFTRLPNWLILVCVCVCVWGGGEVHKGQVTSGIPGNFFSAGVQQIHLRAE